jgi:hypothetical protein
MRRVIRPVMLPLRNRPFAINSPAFQLSTFSLPRACVRTVELPSEFSHAFRVLQDAPTAVLWPPYLLLGCVKKPDA